MKKFEVQEFARKIKFMKTLLFKKRQCCGKIGVHEKIETKVKVAERNWCQRKNS